MKYDQFFISYKSKFVFLQMKFPNRTCRLNTSFHFIVTIAKGVSNPNPFWKPTKKSIETKGWSKSWHIPSLWNHLNSRKMSGSKWTKLFHQCTCHLCQGIYQKVWRTSLTDQRVSLLKFSSLAMFLGFFRFLRVRDE